MKMEIIAIFGRWFKQLM